MCPKNRHVRTVAGAALFEQLQAAIQPWDLARVDKDLACLSRLLPSDALRHHYLQPMLNDGIATVAELFAVARAAGAADHVEPHAAGRGSKVVDALLRFGTLDVALEVKHQRDRFPFNGVFEPLEGGIGGIYSSERPGADTRYLDEVPPERMTQKVPGSEIWRQTLQEAAQQLPMGCPTVVAVSVDAFGGFEEDVVAALVGDSVVTARLYHDGTHDWREERLPNGVFAQASFNVVTGVYFFRLHPEPADDSPEDYEQMCVWARGSKNPNAAIQQLPEQLVFSLPNVYDRPPRTRVSGPSDGDSLHSVDG